MIKIKTLLLAAGKGERLKPLTDDWPKCLMPIGNFPLLEYWLETLNNAGVEKVLVNLHHHAELVRDFLNRPRFCKWVDQTFERELLGTAGTILANQNYFQDCTILLVHADNWCRCNFEDFLIFHQNLRPQQCPITMMTFESPTPQSCGIVDTNQSGVVTAFHEKVVNPPGNRANGAVYLLEPEVLEFLVEQPKISDFSTEVLPRFVGRIATWHNEGIHRDIGDSEMLKKAQLDPKPFSLWPVKDNWQAEFEKHPIHQMVSRLK